LPFHISFIANIARKRPELKRGKTKPHELALSMGAVVLDQIHDR
jgi:hypothetical protein